jgi:peptidoglycan hydrolase-like protein with peptidoglycan-binding domain
MFERMPLFLKRPIAENTGTDPDDVVILKRSLERLGYYRRPEWGLKGFVDDQMFEGLRKFQAANGLRVDGIAQPDGETAGAIGPLIADMKSAHGEVHEEAFEKVAGRPKGNAIRSITETRRYAMW